MTEAGRTEWELECRACGARHDVATDLGRGGPEVGPGDAAICVDCGALSILPRAGDVTWQPTAAEYGRLVRDPDLLAALASVLRLVERRRSGE